MTLAHLTLNTGHLCASPRSEVEETTIRALDPLVNRGGGDVPGMPLKLEIRRQQPGRAIITYEVPGGVVGVSTLCWQEDAQHKAWTAAVNLVRAQAAITGEVLPELSCPTSLPWLAASIAPPAVLLSSDHLMCWGDLERCVAWTILAQEGLAR